MNPLDSDTKKSFHKMFSVIVRNLNPLELSCCHCLGVNTTNQSSTLASGQWLPKDLSSFFKIQKEKKETVREHLQFKEKRGTE